jgi:hypothetical protein
MSPEFQPGAVTGGGVRQGAARRVPQAGGDPAGPRTFLGGLLALGLALDFRTSP